MSIAATFLAESAMSSRLRTLVSTGKPLITISLQSRNKTYTTLDRIEGVVSVTATADTPFDALEIEFVGSARSFVQRITTAAAAAGRCEAYHQFLKLSQPGLARLYPEDNILRAGTSIDFPFVFAVPAQLLPRVCQHHVVSNTVRDAHLRLPPTFGDNALDGGRSAALDDLAPEMASIRYGVFAKVITIKTKDEQTVRTTIAAKVRRVRVVPAVEEQPPLDVHTDDGEYIMRREKTIRKSLFTSKTGTLVMQASQPSAFKLQSYANPHSRTDTVAKIILRFDPADEKCQPPKLNNLASKLKLTTYFGSTARRSFPSKALSYTDLSQGVHSDQMPLSTRSVAGVEWKRYKADSSQPASPVDDRRRNSATSVLSFENVTIPDPSTTYKGGDYYIANLVVPLTLPGTRAFPPTFHTCLISRVYSIKMDLSLQCAGIAPSMELKVPVQISSQGLVGDEFARSGSVDFSVETDIDGDDATGFFEPRMPSNAGIGPFAPVPRARIGSQAPTDDVLPGYSSPSNVTTRVSYRRSSSTTVAPPMPNFSVSVH